MRMDKVAVDDSLSNVQQALTEEGYEVVALDDDLDAVVAIVVNGLDDDVMGIETRETTAPVIDADGLSANEVVEEVREAATQRR